MAIFGKSEHKAPEAVRPSAAPATPAASSRASACLIGAKTVIKGEVTGDEDVVVEGRIEGQVKISKELRIGAGGTVKASIEAQSVLISGEVIGNCTAASRVEIQASGKLTGDIHAPRIVIAEGALFRGTSDMSATQGKGSGGS